MPQASERFQSLLQEAIPLLPCYPEGRFKVSGTDGTASGSSGPAYHGTGVVIVGGGKYFDSAYVTIRVLRHLGYHGPIELWHLPNEMAKWQLDTRIWETVGDVRLVDAGRVLRDHPAYVKHGWQLKSYAILHSSFEKVLYLDSDCYPIRHDFMELFNHPEFLRTGAIYFPDDQVYDLKPKQWAYFGLAPRDEYGFEAGEMYVDKSKVWKELSLALWLNEYADWTWKIVHGDKETFHIAHRLLGTDYAMTSTRWAWPASGSRNGMIQHDLDGRPLFFHRTISKFSLVDSVGVGHFLSTGQVGDKRNDSIPLEAECWEFLEELRAIRDHYVCVVQLEAHGDMFVLLPALKYLARDHVVTLICRDTYASTFEELSWIDVVPFEKSGEHWKEAMGMAWSYGKPILSQVGHVHDPRVKENWSLEVWDRSTVPLDLYHELPLEVDNRDFEAEQTLIATHVKQPHRPLILLNTMGNSSPYLHGDTLRAFLATHYAHDFEILDLAFVRADRVIDLLGLIERASVLISSDTATLHLGYATLIPTVALVRDPDDGSKWGSSERRPHWIEHLHYADSVTPTGMDKIKKAVDGLFHLPTGKTK